MTDTIVYVGSHYEVLIEEQDIPEDLDGDCLITVIDIMLVVARVSVTCLGYEDGGSQCCSHRRYSDYA
jgi:hypothetical protein